MPPAKPVVHKMKIREQEFALTCSVEQHEKGASLTFDAAAINGRKSSGRPIRACHMRWESAFAKDSRELGEVIQQGLVRLKRNVEYIVKHQLLDE